MTKMANFGKFLGQNGENEIFWKKAKMSLPYAYYAATLCKKMERTYKRILRSSSEGRMDGSEFEGPQCHLRRGNKNI